MQRVITSAAGLAGARVLVAGARVTGISAARVLRECGAQVTVTDSVPAQLQALADTGLAAAGVRTEVGLTAVPPGTDLVVSSPGFRPDAPLMVGAREAGVPVVGDVTLARWLDLARNTPPADWLVVTGTNGKTTTVGMLEAMLRAAGLDAVHGPDCQRVPQRRARPRGLAWFLRRLCGR